MEGNNSYAVASVTSDECPVSLITDESRALIEIEAMNHAANKSTGSTLYGSDAGLWPAVWHDVVTLVQIQRGLDEAAFQRSLDNGRR